MKIFVIAGLLLSSALAHAVELKFVDYSATKSPSFSATVTRITIQQQADDRDGSGKFYTSLILELNDVKKSAIAVSVMSVTDGVALRKEILGAKMVELEMADSGRGSVIRIDPN